MRSFRTQVTFWIAGVVALALIVLGTAMSVVNLNQLRAGIDRDLKGRAMMPGGPRRGPGGPPDGQFIGDGQGGPQGFGQFDGPEFQFPQNPPPPGETDVIAMLRRPRILLRDGKLRYENETIFDQKAIDNALRDRAGFSNGVFRGEKIRIYTQPIIRQGTRVAIVQVASDLRAVDQLKAVEVGTMLSTVPLAILAAIGVAFFLTGRVMRPIGEMNRAAKSIAEGDYSARLPAGGLDEFGQLSNQFNHMAEKVEESVTGLQDALDQQRRFTADASHELRTPLTRMRLATGAGLSGPDSEAREALVVADEAAKDMSKLVQQLLDLARADTGELTRRFETVDLRVVASEAASKLTSPVPIEFDLAEEAVNIQGDAHHLERVCLNLLENAIRHTTEGSITLRVLNSPKRIEVQDTGSGIAAEHLPRLTERFYRVDSARGREVGGSGLGLAIVEEMVKAHGGKLEIESHVGVGTTVKVLFS